MVFQHFPLLSTIHSTIYVQTLNTLVCDSAFSLHHAKKYVEKKVSDSSCQTDNIEFVHHVHVHIPNLANFIHENKEQDGEVIIIDDDDNTHFQLYEDVAIQTDDVEYTVQVYFHNENKANLIPSNSIQADQVIMQNHGMQTNFLYKEQLKNKTVYEVKRYFHQFIESTSDGKSVVYFQAVCKSVKAVFYQI
ncbi:hypothetical protein PVAND_012814 [Polypedilum vanderplanki]|uniref:Uncharacterized protein n=1 Tax=Polypedilum vanderplanki TaxID=319348 RepID=A0A9J6CNQ1_POLVA|nr:hypothetical protein PVAND_012814 [Polypedilum vanderplanki]